MPARPITSLPMFLFAQEDTTRAPTNLLHHLAPSLYKKPFDTQPKPRYIYKENEHDGDIIRYKLAPPGLTIPDSLKAEYAHNEDWPNSVLGTLLPPITTITPFNDILLLDVPESFVHTANNTWACSSCYTRFDNYVPVSLSFNGRHGDQNLCEVCHISVTRGNGYEEYLQWKANNLLVDNNNDSIRYETSSQENDDDETYIGDDELSQTSSTTETDMSDTWESSSSSTMTVISTVSQKLASLIQKQNELLKRLNGEDDDDDEGEGDDGKEKEFVEKDKIQRGWNNIIQRMEQIPSFHPLVHVI